MTVSAADDYEVPQNGMTFMCRHLVALVGQGVRIDRDGTEREHGTLAFSGFVMVIDGVWFWVTAGHCLRDLDRQIEQGELRVSSVGFVDFFGLDATDFNPIPFTYEPHCGCQLYRKELGLDFGLIELSPMYVDAMTRNGVVPVMRDNWAKQEGLRFDSYRMLGFPSHLIRDVDENGIQVTPSFSAVSFVIDRVDPSDVSGVESNSWFVGQIGRDTPISDIKGMSGGPIFGFRRSADGNVCYHVVALQSWWRDKRRIVFGCSIPFFAEEVRKVLIKARTNK